MTDFSQILYSDEFNRDFKKLTKKYTSLDEDLKTCIKIQLKLFHKLNIDNNGIFQISGLGFEQPKIFKIKKFACKSLKGTGNRSGIRIIYAYFEDINKIEFIEIYHKNKKELEDKKRIQSKYN